MRRIIIILSALLLPLASFAQDYEKYLDWARNHIRNGNYPKAQSCYNVYVELTNKRDAEVEKFLSEVQQEKDNNNNNNNNNNNTQTIKYSNGDKYIGQIVNGARHGKGTYYFANGNRYEGDFVYDKMTGKGTFYWANGDRYEGDFVDGKRNGYGTVYWNAYSEWAGNRYEGEWKNGHRNGKGTYYYADGRILKGTWKDDAYQGK